MSIAANLVVFVGCLALSLVATWCVRNFAVTHGLVDAPKLDRHLHREPVPRLGGVAIFLSFAFAMGTTLLIPRWIGLANPLPASQILHLLGPALIIFFLGLYDDLRPIGPYWKFGVQVVAAVSLYFNGFGIHHLHLVSSGLDVRSFVGLPLTVLWVLLITNAFNLIDGLDGLAAGSALFSTVVVFIISLAIPNPLVTFLTIALAGSILGFLRFNFHPASIFLGDSGSLFIGFMLSALALVGSEKAPTIVAVAIPVVSLGLPILDVALAVVRRFLARKPIFTGDASHIHHQLLKRGFSQRNAVLTLYVVTAAFGFLSLVLFQERRVIALVLAVAGVGIFFGLQQLRYREFAELISTLQRVNHRRQMLANHVAIRHAADSLKECHEFLTICSVLQTHLEPIGFDGIRVQMINKNGFQPACFEPLSYGPDGSLFFLWSGCKVAAEPSWQLRIELVTNSYRKWGYFTLLRISDGETLALDVNVLTEDFRKSLSDAFDRACALLEAAMQSDEKVHEGQTHKLAAGSMTD
jgi:UDP-GlcNAc:undecaprenyl-phosphate/decaprenyl-phosphate GlcNAc-1-phosphate transferase